jgi:hypothetical protein
VLQKKLFLALFVYNIIGTNSEERATILPINSEIASLINQVFLKVVGVVKNKIYAKKTRLHLQIITIRRLGCEASVVINNLTKQYSSKQPNQGFILRK